MNVSDLSLVDVTVTVDVDILVPVDVATRRRLFVQAAADEGADVVGGSG